MILVTGATGFVGSYLAMQLLEKQASIRAIYTQAKSIEKTKNIFKHHQKVELFKNIEWIQANITDTTTLSAAFEGIEQVYHCAALVSFNPKDEEKLQKINIEGTANIVNFCVDFKVKKLCYVSSIAALGDAKEHETLITEESEWNTALDHSDYAITKHGAETEVWRASQEGVEVIIVNPGVIFGYFIDENNAWNNGSGKIFEKIYKGFPFYTEGKTAIIAVEDVVNAMIMLMNATQKNEQYILVAENVRYQNILETIALSIHKKTPSVKISKNLMVVIRFFDSLFALILFKGAIFSKPITQSLFSQDEFSSEKFIAQFKYQFLEMKPYVTALGRKFLTDKSTQK